MTPDELKKDAERIILQGRKMNIEIGGPVMGAFILDALRAVHDAAIEKAARLLEERDCECEESNCCSGYNYIEKIRALKSGDGE